MLSNELVEALGKSISAQAALIDNLKAELKEKKKQIETNEVQIEQSKIERDLNKNEIDRYKSELESVIANANLKAESDKKEIEGYKRELETVTAKLMHENYGLSTELERSRAAIDKYKTERVKSAAAFKDVITLKNAKICFFTPFSLSQSQSQIRQLEVELMKVQAESDFYQEKVKSMVETESTKAVGALRLELQQFKTESEFRKKEVDRYKAELINMAKKSKAESDGINKDLQTERAKTRQLEIDLVKVQAESAAYQKELKSKTAAESNALQTRIADQKLLLTLIGTNQTLSKSVATLGEMKKENEQFTSKSINLLNTIRDSNQTVISARFTEISKLSSYNNVYSRPITFAGAEWKIVLRKNGDHLYFYLKGEKDYGYTWSCSAFTEFQLISHKSPELILRQGGGAEANVFKRDKHWGYDKFISFKDLFDQNMGFVKDDSILVAVVLKAFSSN